jgi:small-conductance mechanosensitive channel
MKPRYGHLGSWGGARAQHPDCLYFLIFLNSDFYLFRSLLMGLLSTWIGVKVSIFFAAAGTAGDD